MGEGEETKDRKAEKAKGPRLVMIYGGGFHLVNAEMEDRHCGVWLRRGINDGSRREI